METIKTINTYDDSDCADTGWEIKLRSDGSIRLQYISRWQGSRCGATWITPPGTIKLPPPDAGEEDDAEARLTDWVSRTDLPPENAKQVRRGFIVR